MKDQLNKNENINQSDKHLLGSFEAEKILHNNVNNWSARNLFFNLHFINASFVLQLNFEICLFTLLQKENF